MEKHFVVLKDDGEIDGFFTSSGKTKQQVKDYYFTEYGYTIMFVWTSEEFKETLIKIVSTSRLIS